MVMHRYLALAVATISPLASAFAPPTSHVPSLLLSHRTISSSSLYSAAPSDTSIDNEIPPAVGSAAERVEECKRTLVFQCDSHELGSGYDSNIESKIQELEQLGEDAGELIHFKNVVYMVHLSMLLVNALDL